MWTDPGKHAQTHKCGNWDCGRAISFLGIHKCDFHCSALEVSVKRQTMLPGRVFSTAACPTLKFFERMLCVHNIFLTHAKIVAKIKLCENRKKAFFLL
jgi:hypothetical protein